LTPQDSKPRTDARRLPLEPLETYMLADDGERYPRTFVIGLEFSGRVDPKAFETALRHTLADEPLLCAVAMRRGVFRHVWEIGASDAVRVEWRDAALGEALTGRRLDLRTGPGLRIIGLRANGTTRMEHVFHHACCDGVGGLAFLGRLYAAYSRLVAPGALAECRPADPGLIGGRRPVSDLPARIGSRAAARKASIGRAWDVLTTRKARLMPRRRRHHDESADARISFPGALTQVLSEPQTRALKQAARRGNATLNDVLVAAAFQALRDWNVRIDPAADEARYEILVPVDLRSPEHDGLPAASLVSCVFVKQPGALCDDRDRLLRAVADRMRYAVASRSGLIMYHAIRRLTRVPGLLPLVLRAWRTQATALVSYVGDAGRGLGATFEKDRGKLIIGGLPLERITAAGPVRPGTAANLTAGSYAGQLTLNLLLDPHQFSGEDTRELLELVVARLLGFVVHPMAAVAAAEEVAGPA
jgi:hypothetical protein